MASLQELYDGHQFQLLADCAEMTKAVRRLIAERGWHPGVATAVLYALSVEYTQQALAACPPPQETKL